MKKIFYTAVFIWVSSIWALAQVDRKQPPQPLPERPVNFGKVENFTLPNGLKVIVVENHKLPVVRVDVNLDITAVKEGDKAGYTSMFGDMLRAGTLNYTKEELDEKIDFLGSDFYAGSTYLGVSSLKKQLIPSMKILQELLYNASFSNQEELNRLKKQAKTALEADEKNPDAISGRVRNVLLYGKEDAWGEYETEKTLSNITLADFKNYYSTYFKPNIAYLTIVGDISLAEAKALAEECFASWEKGEVSQEIPALKKNKSGVKIAFVDLPSATQSSISVMGLADLKKSDTDYFSGIIGNSILGDGSSGRLFKDLREKHGWTYGAYSALKDSYKRSGNFSAYAKVRNNVTDSAVAALMKNINDITKKAPSEEELSIKKSEYTGNFSLGLEKPETTGRFVRTQMVENLSPDFYKNYLKNIDAVSANQIPIALSKIIDPENLTVLIVGKGEEVIPKIEKLGYPVLFYDKYGNPVDNPTAKKGAENITSTQVLDKYFTAVAGSRAKIDEVKSMITEAEMPAPQLPEPAIITTKFQSPNKIAVTVSAMGKIILKQGFDGEKGCSNMGTLPEEQLEEFKSQKGYFPELELFYNNKIAVLDGIISVERKDAYRIVMNTGNVKKSIYFDTQTGFKVREEISSGDGLSVTDYLDYKEFGGYKLPTKIVSSFPGQENMTQIIKNYIINPALTEKDFKAEE